MNGTEWLAFEPEHAMVFARPHRGPPSVYRPPNEDDDGGEHRGHRGELRRRDAHGAFDEHSNHPPPPPLDSLDENDAGYLHTYAAAKDLRLL